MTQDERNAYHHAGQAVCYFLGGWTITQLSITAIDVEQPTNLDHNDLLYSRLVSLVAGPLAEQRAAQETTPQGTKANLDDIQITLKTIGTFVSEDARVCSAVIEYCKKYVDGIFAKRWKEVASLTAALLECKEIPGDKVHEILGTTMRPDVVDRRAPAILHDKKTGKDIELIEGVDFERIE
jgi:hypothetical protein